MEKWRVGCGGEVLMKRRRGEEAKTVHRRGAENAGISQRERNKIAGETPALPAYGTQRRKES
jgi:hypothetical protein